MPLADAVNSANNGSDCAFSCPATSLDVAPQAATQSHSRLVKRMPLSPRRPAGSRQSCQHLFHVIRVKIQLAQMGAIENSSISSDDKDAAGPGLICLLNRAVHP